MNCAALLPFAVTSAALAWGAHGHRMITHLALDAFEPTSPAWLDTDAARARIAYQSNECDRWKGTPTHAINHVNKPDHFIDIEHLPLMGMSFDDLSPLRRDYIAQIAIARNADPAAIPATYKPETDPAKAYEYPGFLPYAILEHYEKLRSSFHTIRIIESLDDPTRAHQLEQAKHNAVYHMGMLSHFVADASQPLHTTEHFNGWVGDNPNNYTTETTFHADIDTNYIASLDITLASFAEYQPAAIELDPADPWPAILAYINTSFRLVEPTYVLEQLGSFNAEPGKAFLESRLAAGADMLGALYAAAWTIAEPSEDQVKSFIHYGDHRPQGD